MNQTEQLIGVAFERAPSLADQAYEALKSFVVSGRLEPGAALSENDLSRRFAISRSPLREAVRRLQDEGLLDATGPRGFRVPPLSTDLVREVYGVRIALEGRAAALATPPDAQTLDDWEVRLNDIEAALNKGDLEPFNASDVEFHNLFILNCGNRLLITHIERLRGSIERIINFAGQHAEHTAQSFAEHRAIFAQLSVGGVKLRDAVETHIAGVSSRLEKLLDDG